ncbi:hypothetical protein MC7420_3205 [Coleofasciculus chthonoplastes PCC 7420]|uniref:Uncharacterized protein n=1 Tax=Coleofasciculus chthonoplastes PCC 7420 TaxID=118168 RepID=B4VJM5_9CYAN|nr:hypothetical protein MC7420_3205 [Coleofasciculus chthonoplastes PCC 7420]
MRFFFDQQIKLIWIVISPKLLFFFVRFYGLHNPDDQRN